MNTVFPTSDHILHILERIPENPGVYQYFDENGVIIYVGKAKNLKKRVYSYFNKSHEDSPKTRILVKKIRDLKYIVVNSEEDALLLENNLIKQHRPRYNVLLKDDKTYPSICIKKEPFPRVFQTRNIVQDGSEYFGPYSSVPTVKALLDVIRKAYPLRSCKLPMLSAHIQQNKYKVCLDYQIKKCLGPCEGFQTETDYLENIRQIREILKGNVTIISKQLREKMEKLASELKFEEAHAVKVKFDLIEQYRSKSAVVNTVLHNLEVFSYDETDQSAIVNHLYIVHGSIVRGLTVEYKKRVEEPAEELLSSAIFEFRNRFGSNAREIVVPFLPSIQLEGVHYGVPQRGDKKILLDLSVQNVRQYKVDLLKQQDKLNPEQRSTRVLTTAKKDLNLMDLPIHIECFDNSNTQGSFPVSSCVVFKNAKPSKKDYRHFNIKTVEGPNDFASMEEVLSRRYQRMLDEGSPLPQLIVVDGGKGQLSSAVFVLKSLGLMDRLKVIGIAKNLEEIFFPEDPIPLYLDKNSETLRLIQQLRDEAHRFGITHHRKRRSKNQLTSELDSIPGIGIESKTQLLKYFKSVKRLREATLEDISQVVGPAKARKVVNFIQTDKL